MSNLTDVMVSECNHELKEMSFSSNRGSFYGFIKSLPRESLEQSLQQLKEAIKQRDVNEQSSKGSTALHACAYLKLWDLAKFLLDHGADGNIKNNAGHTFWKTTLRVPFLEWSVVLKDYKEQWERLEKDFSKKKGVKVKRNVSEIDGVSLSVYEHNIFEYLKSNDFESLFYYAGTLPGNVCVFTDGEWWDRVLDLPKDVIVRFLNSGISFEKKKFTGKSPLILLVEKNNLELLKVFLENGFDVNSRMADGNSAFICAIKLNNFEIFEFLINFVVDVKNKNKYLNDLTPLEYVRAHGLDDFQELLEIELDLLSMNKASNKINKNRNNAQKGKKVSRGRNDEKFKSKKEHFFVAKLDNNLKEAQDFEYSAPIVEARPTIVVVKRKRVPLTDSKTQSNI